MMGAFLYGTALQWRLDIRSRTLLITCYVVPLLFFAMMGGPFTSVNPSARETLVPSMTVMGVSMGALIGLPPSLVEIYGSDIKKMYKANGVPLYFGLIPALLSTFLHLMLMSAVIYLAAPPAFGAAAPAIPVKDTIKVSKTGGVDETPDRKTLFAVQTPQVFDTALLLGALQNAKQKGLTLTDDCSAVEALGMTVLLTDGSEENIKITTPLDLEIAELILKRREET